VAQIQQGTQKLNAGGSTDVNIASVGGNVVTTTVPVSGSVTAIPPARAQVPGLSFVQTISPLGTYQTSWVDVEANEWLDFDVQVGTASAITATLEYTDASNPNVTPPGSNDIVRALTETIAGTAISGLTTNILSFGIPAQMSWARLTVVDLTGGQTVRVSTYNQPVTPTAAQLPIAANVTSDFRVPLMRAVGVGKVPTGAYQNLPVGGLDSNNSSTATLGSNATFSGTVTSRAGYLGLEINIKTDQISAVNGIVVNHYADSAGATLIASDYYSFTASDVTTGFKFITNTLKGSYYKIVYTNGVTGQGAFNLSTR